MDSPTLLALIGFGFVALLTVFFIYRFFSGASSSRSSSAGRSGQRRRSRMTSKIQGFEQRGNGDSYVNLFGLFSAAAVEEANAKKAEEQESREKKAAAQKARADMVSSSRTAAAQLWHSFASAVKRLVAPKPLPNHSHQQAPLPTSAQSSPVELKRAKKPVDLVTADDGDARFG